MPGSGSKRRGGQRTGKRSRPGVVAGALIVQAAVAAVTLRDLARRSPEQVRGPKIFWQIAGTVNTFGSIAYWLVGRKTR